MLAPVFQLCLRTVKASLALVRLKGFKTVFFLILSG